MAVASYFGAALVAFVLGIPFLLAVIFGIVSLVRISRSQGALRGKGFAVTGLVLGALGLCSAPLAILFLSLAPASVRASHLAEARPTAPRPSRSSSYPPEPAVTTGKLRLEISIRNFNGDESDGESLVHQLEARLASYAAEVRPHPDNDAGSVRLLIELDPDADPLLGELERLEQRARLLERVRELLQGIDAETGWLQGRFEVEPAAAGRAREYPRPEEGGERARRLDDEGRRRER